MRKRYFCKMFVMLISTTLLSAGCFSHAIPVLAEETASESDSPVDTNLDCDIQTDEVSNQENDSVTDSNQCEEPESSDAMEESVTTEDSEQDSLDGSIKDDIVQEEEAPEAKEIENYGDISSATSFSGTGYEVWDGKTMTQPSRSLLDIYQVGTPAELKWIQNEVNVKGNNVLRFALTDDINLGNYPWTPIGTEEKPFDGRVFGDNHTIYNMNITPESSKGSASCGLFGTIAVTSTISYLTVNGSINSNANYIGGIVGRVEGVEGAYTWLSYCTSNVSITIGEGASWCYCGGIAGTIEYGRVRNCINNGEITNIGKQDYTVGGIVGSVIGTSIIDCKNTGEIKGGIAGGIAGNSRDESSFVEMCYNTGTINASYIACGLVGDLRNSHLAHGYNDAPVVLFGSSGRLAAPCAFDYYSFYDTEDLWYTNYIEGESTCGTYTEFGDLMFNVRIEGFKTVCGGAPALLWEETEEHNLGSYEKYLGYEKRDCNKCTYTEINWEDERLQVIYYDENAVSAIAFIDSYKFDPWYLNSRYNSSSFNPILPDKSLISEEIKDYDVASSLCLNFSLKKPAIIKADYSLFHALYNEQLTITIARRIDDRHEWLCNDIFQGSYEGSETMLLEPGDYYFRALVNKTEDNTGDDYGAYGVITHLSIISSEIPLTITSQPQSIASAKIGDTVSYRVSAENVSSYQWQYSKDGKEWF
ncbi:MAG: GLUG motif-containing protein, partial [Lachnospiraceae bacterium]|nr:GLUG motif-containing protein [Lachnospiraceae bacterium]